jgi:hypothetical protein
MMRKEEEKRGKNYYTSSISIRVVALEPEKKNTQILYPV